MSKIINPLISYFIRIRRSALTLDSRSSLGYATGSEWGLTSIRPYWIIIKCCYRLPYKLWMLWLNLHLEEERKYWSDSPAVNFAKSPFLQLSQQNCHCLLLSVSWWRHEDVFYGITSRTHITLNVNIHLQSNFFNPTETVTFTNVKFSKEKKIRNFYRPSTAIQNYSTPVQHCCF